MSTLEVCCLVLPPSLIILARSSDFFFWLCCAACGILVPQSGIEPGPSEVKTRSPNHWTAREFLRVDLCCVCYKYVYVINIFLPIFCLTCNFVFSVFCYLKILNHSINFISLFLCSFWLLHYFKKSFPILSS